MNNQQLANLNQQPSNPNFPFVYDSAAYDNSLLNELPLTNTMGVDSTSALNPSQNPTAANFAYPYGFSGFGDQLNFSNFPYFSNQTPSNYLPIPTTTFPSTSLSLPAPIQSNALYPQHQQNLSNLPKQPTAPTNNDPLRSNHTRLTKQGVDKLLSRREKPKRKRILFTAEQIRIMEEHFKQTQFTQHTERIKLANIIGLTPQQIKIWYQNRRYKEKLTIRNPGDSKAPTPKRSSKSSPNSLPANLSNMSLKMDDGVKLECKQAMDNQIMAMQNAGQAATDYFPSIYSNWQQTNQQPSPFFPFNPEMYANSFPGQQLNNPVNYPQMFQNFNSQAGFNPLAYYNSTNGSISGPQNTPLIDPLSGPPNDPSS